MLSEAASRDAEEDTRYGKDRRGDRAVAGPEDLRRREERLGRLRACKGKLEAQKEAARRAQTVELVFGQIKDARELDGFCRRGEPACESERAVIRATRNLLKLFRSGKALWN